VALSVTESGTPAAPSIVFLHGVGASGWMWKPQLAALRDCHCLNVDLPGHGRSNTVPWRSLADTADQVAALIRERATGGRAHVVGLSLGGYVTLVMLKRHADLVQRAVVSGVTASPMPNGWLLPAQVWFMGSIMKRRGFLNWQANALHLAPDLQADFVENYAAMSMDAYRRILEEAVDFRAPDALRRVSTPTLVVAGSRESKIILESVEAIPRLMPNAQGWLALGQRHGWNVDAPDLFSAMLRAWFTEAPLPVQLRQVVG
jgi:pimeloyl-ACP methyl ester carboxylesterase